MKPFTFFTLLLVLAFGNTSCSTNGSAKSKQLYSNNNGPSKESGDCGGYSFWIEKEQGIVIDGSAAEYEGGCKTYQKPIFDINHDKATDKVVFFFDSSDSSQWTRVEGYFRDGNFEARLQQVDKKTKTPIFKQGQNTVFHHRVHLK